MVWSSCAAVVCVGDLYGPMDGVDLGMVGCECMTASCDLLDIGNTSCCDLMDVTSHSG